MADEQNQQFYAKVIQHEYKTSDCYKECLSTLLPVLV